MEAFQRIQLLGVRRLEALDVAETAFQEALPLVNQAREEGYSMEAIAQALGSTRVTLYAHLREPTTEPH